MRDLLPAEMQARQWLIDRVRAVYESYGFVPLGTPAVEHLDVLLGASAGREAAESIFHVRGPEPEPLGLRFDLTVPLARVVSQYVDLPRPFRRYQVASVWRADNPGRGRYREFTQFDIDSVGVPSELADVEIIAAMCDTLDALDVGGYRVRVSSRRVLNLALPYADIAADRGPEVFRVLDKLDKLGMAKIRAELTIGYKDESGSRVAGLGFTDAQVDRIEEFLAIRAPARDEVLRQLRAKLGAIPSAETEIESLAAISRRLAALGYDDERVALDVSIARGLAYYTGPVFEANLLDAPEFGAIFAGGRYDNLVMRFLGESAPAVGASIGIDRLLAALVERKRISLRKSTAQVLVTTIDRNLTDEYLAMTFELRRAGVRTEMYLGAEQRFGKQVRYGDLCEVPILVVYGSDEHARGIVQLKDMFAGKARAGEVADRGAWKKERPGQVEAPRAELVARVRQMLADGGVA